MPRRKPAQCQPATHIDAEAHTEAPTDGHPWKNRRVIAAAQRRVAARAADVVSLQEQHAERKAACEAYDTMRAARPLTPPSRRVDERVPRSPGEIEAAKAQRADEQRLHRARLLSWAHLSERKS
jgi:hypothetical protein